MAGSHHVEHSLLSECTAGVLYGTTSRTSCSYGLTACALIERIYDTLAPLTHNLDTVFENVKTRLHMFTGHDLRCHVQYVCIRKEI